MRLLDAGDPATAASVITAMIEQQAESIMDAKKAKDYDRAVEWLRIARDIYRQHGRDAEWQAYLRSLLSIHERKYKLVPMLRAIMT